MRHAEDIIIRPIMTEKSYAGMAEGKYTFEVALTATKVDIKKAVEELFSVKVLKVNTMRYDGKKKNNEDFYIEQQIKNMLKTQRRNSYNGNF